MSSKENLPSSFKPYSPYGLIPRTAMDLFQEFGKGMDFFASMWQERGLEIKEDKKNVYVKAALPGVKVDEIEINLDRNILEIKGEASEKKEEKGEEKRVLQQSQKSFWYRCSLPGSIDEQVQPNASFDNGILEITIPKSEKTKKKINIKTKK